MDKLPRRKDIRLKSYDYLQAGYYFITICTKDRNKLLANIVGAGFHASPIFATWIIISILLKFVLKKGELVLICVIAEEVGSK